MLCAATAATAAATLFAAPPAADLAAFGTAADPSIEARLAAVSYTHLTLPTKA